MSATKTIAIEVREPEDVGARIDVVLGRRVPGLSRRMARALAKAGAVRVDGRRSAPSVRASAGMTIELAVGDAAPIDPPRIVACSDRFVYVDKPAGLHTHRLRPGDPPSVADAVARVHPECAAASIDPREGGAIQRLDAPTTGVVAFARARAAWLEGRAALGAPGTIKLYVAVCERVAAGRWVGDPCEVPGPLPSLLPQPQSTQPLQLEFRLGHGDARASVGVRDDGRRTRSTVLPLGRDDADRHRIVALWLHTGHRHQARVHLAELGWPIVGDVRYGSSPGALLLHCVLLDLRAALPDEPVAIAPPPLAFAATPSGAPWHPWADDRAP